jgi:hypothetical protein
MYLLSDYLRQPLPEIRIAAFGLLRSLANYDWGIKFMFDHPGFLEFLLHRDSETTKLGKEWKYSIVEAVVRNPWTKQRITNDSYIVDLFLSDFCFYSLWQKCKRQSIGSCRAMRSKEFSMYPPRRTLRSTSSIHEIRSIKQIFVCCMYMVALNK